MAWTPEQYEAYQRERGQVAFKEAQTAKPKPDKRSKHGNIPCIVTADLTLFPKPDIEQAERHCGDPLTGTGTLKDRAERAGIFGEYFQSIKEGRYWIDLRLREKAGEIRDLKTQVSFPLYTPVFATPGEYAQDSTYDADFVYFDNDEVAAHHVIDIKGGKNTRSFASKRKRLFLQQGIEVEIIR